MSETLKILIEENNDKLNTKTVINKLKKTITSLIKDYGWSKSIKFFIDNYLEVLENDDFESILSYWNKYSDNDIVFIALVKDYTCSRKILEKIFNKIHLSGLKDLLIKTIEMLVNNNNFHIIANYLTSFYENRLNNENYLELLDYTYKFNEKTDINIDTIVQYFNHKKSLYVYADIPDWVSIKEGENLSLLITLSPGKDYENLKEEVVNIVDKAEDYFFISNDEGKSIENKEVNNKVKEALMSYLHISSLEKNPESSYSANRVFGPSNRFIDRNCISNPGKEGPCRMLECLCIDSPDETGYNYIIEEWFTGKCDNFECSKRIRDRSHAIRFPVEGGGWKGCFCCFSCMEKSIFYRDKDTNFRIEYMKSALHEDGIMDRTKT